MRASFNQWWLCLFVAAIIGCGGKEDPKPAGGEKPAAKTDDTKTGDTTPKGSGNSTAGNPSAVAKNGFDASYISEDFFAALVLHPRKLMNADLVKNLPPDMKDQVLQNMPFDPATIEQVVLLAAPFPPDQLMMMMGGRGHDQPGDFQIPSDTPTPRTSEPERDPSGAAAPGNGESCVPATDDDAQGDADVENSAAVGPQDGPAFADNFAAIIRFVDADSAKEIITMITSDSESYEHNGKKYFKPYEGAEEAGFVPDDKTVVVGGEGRIKKILSMSGVSMSPLITRLSTTPMTSDVLAIAAVDPIRELLAGVVPAKPAGDESPIPDGPEMLKKLKSLAIFANISAGDLLSVQIETTGGAATTEVKDALNGLLAFGKMMAPAALKQAAEASAEGALAGKVAGQLLEAIKVAQDGDTVAISIARPAGLDELVNQAIETAKTAAASAQKMNDLKQVGLAMHNYHDVNRAFPDNGKREGDGEASSWRVKVLPYLEEQFLYESYKFDEAWDSDNNKTLVAQPNFWTGRMEGATKTSIMVFTGKGTPFSEEKPATSFASILDGTSNTIYAVQLSADRGVWWSQPVDIAYDVENPLKCLGEIPAEGILAVFFDGSVHTIPKDIDAETFRKLVDPADGEPVEFNF